MKNETQNTYNGHPSWAHWNVSLWLYNDEATSSLVANTAEKVAYMQKTRADALRDLLAILPRETPDGALYTAETVEPVLQAEIDYQIQHS